jgi:hypothetical protein
VPVVDVIMIRFNLFLKEKVIVVSVYDEHKRGKFYIPKFQRTLENANCAGYSRFDHLLGKVYLNRDG